MQTAILTTVNAPYQDYLGADELAAAISNASFTLGQVGSFFTETPADAQLAFGQEYGITADKLHQLAHSFADWSGQSVTLAE